MNVPDLGKTPYLISFGAVASSTISMVDLVNESIAAQLDGMDAAGGNRIARLHPTTRGHQLLAQSAWVTLRATYPAVHQPHKAHGPCR